MAAIKTPAFPIPISAIRFSQRILNTPLIKRFFSMNFKVAWIIFK